MDERDSRACNPENAPKELVVDHNDIERKLLEEYRLATPDQRVAFLAMCDVPGSGGMSDHPLLPRPMPGDCTHRILIDLSEAEFACLAALADRWCSVSAAAKAMLLTGLQARWTAEQGAESAP